MNAPRRPSWERLAWGQQFWERSNMTERRIKTLGFLRSVGIVVLVAALGPGSLSGAPDEAPHRKVRTRRDVMSLAPDGPEIAAFRRAVKVMKSRPVSDPTSWDFQVAIHATKDRSKPGVWNQCQHGNYFFLPWH